MIAFRVTERASYEAQTKVINVTGLPNRRPVNQRGSFKVAGKARAMGHLVFWSRDPERSIASYRDRLGFRVTDSYQNNGGIFARAKGMEITLASSCCRSAKHPSRRASSMSSFSLAMFKRLWWLAGDSSTQASKPHLVRAAMNSDRIGTGTS